MGRPCEHPDPHVTQTTCGVCRLCLTDARYARLYGCPPPVSPAAAIVAPTTAVVVRRAEPGRTKLCCHRGETLRDADGRARTREFTKNYG